MKQVIGNMDLSKMTYSELINLMRDINLELKKRDSAILEARRNITPKESIKNFINRIRKKKTD